jgi:hypothetical protein
MNTNEQKTNRKAPTSTEAGVENTPGNAREREMGRESEPLGDLGDKKTRRPPTGEQGMSNRPDDDLGTDDVLDRDFDDDGEPIDGESSEEAEAEVKEQLGLGDAGAEPRRAGGDPVANQDPNAENSSLTADADDARPSEAGPTGEDPAVRRR